MSPQHGTILLIEGDSGTAPPLGPVLTGAGFTVHRAATVAEAASLGGTDLLVLDSRASGGLEGISHYRQLQAAGHAPPALLVTGHAEPAVVAEALRLRLRHFPAPTAEYLEHLPLAVAESLHQAWRDRESAEAEARLAALVAASPHAVIGLDAGMRVTRMNAAAERAFRCTAAAAAGQAIGRWIPELADAEAAAALLAPRAGGNGSSGPVRRETRGVRADGDEFPLEVGLVRGAAGGRPFYFLFLLDLTEIKRAGQELRAREEMFRLLSLCSPVGIFLTDLEGRVTYANPRCLAICGLTFEEGRGMGWVRRLHPEDRARVCDDWEASVRGHREFSSEHRWVLPEGGVRWTLVRAAPLLSDGGQLLGHVGTVEDVTERKRSTERIREQATLLDKATDAILVRDVDGRVVYWNHSAERLYGWTIAEALGRDVADLLFRGDRGRLAQVTQEVLARGEWSGELRQLSRDGKEVVVSSRWTLVRDAEGRPRSVLVVNTDVTAKQELQAQFLRAQRLESIGTLAGGIAHDLNNMLTPIQMGIQLLQNWHPDAESQAVLANMQHSTDRGAQMVRQVMLFARGEQGPREAVQLRYLAQELQQLLRHTLPKSIELVTDVPRDLWPVPGDATQIHQVLMNLCVNARDAMPRGGTLAVVAANVRLDESFARLRPPARPGPYVRLRVRDTGAGIPTEHLDQIFDPFFTTKSPGHGTGLGLSTVLGIVRGHGGFINVKSRPGEGSEFTVYLPALEEVPPAPTRVAPDALPKGGGEAVLVVDDEATVRDIARTVLETQGYRVLQAAEGAEAVAVFAEHQADVRAVLVDLMMPVMDGPATIRALRALSPKVPVLLVSGTDTAQTGAPDGAAVQGVLMKPYTARELLEAVARVLSPKV